MRSFGRSFHYTATSFPRLCGISQHDCQKERENNGGFDVSPAMKPANPDVSEVYSEGVEELS